MASERTRQLFADAFEKLALERGIDAVFVSDVVEEAGKNRKTFYYHFKDKSQLLRWMFRSDLAQELESAVDARDLVYEEPGEGAFAELPYYARVRLGVRSLDGAPSLEALARCLERRRGLYAQALLSRDAGSLSAYMRELFVPALRDDVQLILSGRYLPRESVDFLAEFFAGAMLEYLAMRAIGHPDEEILGEIGPFANIIHSSIADEIRNQQQSRTL